MTGSKVPLKIIPTKQTHSSGKTGGVPTADKPTSPKPKLFDHHWEALRLSHYSVRTAQIYLIYTHVLNRGLIGVRSHVDAL